MQVMSLDRVVDQAEAVSLFALLQTRLDDTQERFGPEVGQRLVELQRDMDRESRGHGRPRDARDPAEAGAARPVAATAPGARPELELSGSVTSLSLGWCQACHLELRIHHYDADAG